MFPVGLENFSSLFTTEYVWVSVAASLCNGVLLYFASLKFFLVMQQCDYRNGRFFKWLKHRQTPYLRRLMLLCLLGLLFFCVLNMCFAPVFSYFFDENGNEVVSYVGLFSYLLFTLIYVNTESSVNAKVPLRKTKRLVRLAIVFILLAAIITWGLTLLLNYLAYVIGDTVTGILRFAPVCIMPILTPYILFLSNCINKPFESIVKYYYINKAKQKLDGTDVLKIGITGSYGKTTVKEILKTLLSVKYRVLSTPASYNTPYGIALTVKNLDDTHDVFIAEMGARTKGDVKELVNIVKPTFGVLTGVNNQHLETFGSIENTKNTKYELFEGLPENGKGFFTADNDYSVELYNRFGGEKYLCGLNGEEDLVTVSDMVTSSKGTSFTLNIKGEEPLNCVTSLLGKHSISNICLAVGVAYKAGLTPEEIYTGLNRVTSVGHRLELVPNNKNVVIIDDSYNASVDGTKAAMEVLDVFDGRKIVVTPGLVELGKEENVANFNFGKELARHADVVIVIGNHNGEIIVNGLIDGGMDKKNIRFAKNLKKGNETLNELLKEGDVVLFENDLPDNYN